jgi:hypothetical protein
MSSAEQIVEIAADGVADGMHVVGEEALALEEATRGLEAMNLAYFGLGLAIGAATAGFAAWKIAYRKAEEKYNLIAAEEIAEMTEHFYRKEMARDAEQEKGDLRTLVKDRGYVPEEEQTTPPMAVTPPSAVVERAEEANEEDEVEEPPAPEEDERPQEQNVFRDVAVEEEEEWDWHKERSRRSPLRPFVIHRDEREEHEAYEGVFYTYYEKDDVVCDERDDVIDEDRRAELIGEENLEKFGHGSGDPTVVYVRNPKLEIDMEICKSPNSYAEEVHGVEPTIKHSHRRRGGRARFDDE